MGKLTLSKRVSTDLQKGQRVKPAVKQALLKPKENTSSLADDEKRLGVVYT